MVIFAFDFSINKPAATVWRKGKDKSLFGNPTFLTWPLSLTKREEGIFNEMMYSDNGGFLFENRNLTAISKSSNLTSSEMALEHTKRSVNLADIIVRDLESLAAGDPGPYYFVSEGLSFGSKGNSALDLATYKGVLMAEVYKHFKDIKIYTYAPTTIKSIAGCATKDKAGDKHAMIKAFIEDTRESNNVFAEFLRDGTLSYEKTKGKDKGGIEYIHCVDDIVDSYFAFKTLVKKEGVMNDC